MGAFNINQPPGSGVVATAGIPSNAAWALLTVDAVPITDPALLATMRMLLSLNGGVSWFDHSTITIDGKTAQIGHGQPPKYEFCFFIPEVGTNDRQVRAMLEVVGATLATTGNLTLSANNPIPP